MWNEAKSAWCSAPIRSMSSSGDTPSRSALSMTGVPCASSAQTKWISAPRMRWKRTQTSVWMYSTRWPMWMGPFA